MHVVSDQDHVPDARLDRKVDRLEARIPAVAERAEPVHREFVAPEIYANRLDVESSLKVPDVSADLEARKPARITMMLPPISIAGVENVCPRDEPVTVVDRDYPDPAFRRL